MGESKPRVFLSYARADDEAFVERLHTDLIRQEIEVWWDREAMASRGRSFLQEIRDAIENVDRVIAVVGPRAISSDYVRSEWEHALLFAKGVVPILRLGSYHLIPAELLPEGGDGLAAADMKRLHGPDFRTKRPYRKAFAELVRILREPVPKLAICHGVPALPPHFLPRRDAMIQLKESVLADIRRPTVITSMGQVTALQGMGGIGKSVLAAAFSRTIATRWAFADGVIWLSAGQEATELTRLNNLKQVGVALGDDPTHYADDQSARSRLPTVLAEKVCLVVVDDVWSMDQVERLRDALGPRSRLLVTTRDTGLVTALGARRNTVNLLPNDQALLLLADWSSTTRNSLPPEAQLVARQCGNLPFALALCGALLRDNPDRWSSVLQRLKRADIGKIRQRLPNYPYPDVFRAMQVSIDALTPDERQRYFELAAFPEDTPIPEGPIATLWRLDHLDAQDLLDLFVRRSLAQRHSPGRVSLHDLLTDYVRSHCPNLSALHNRLVENYATSCRGDWAYGPDDGYFFQHLPRHMAEADRRHEIESLLCNYNWIAAKLEATDIQSLVSDYDLVKGKPDLDLLQRALRLSSLALAHDPKHLRSQLIGRLCRFDDRRIRALLQTASQYCKATWLCPQTASLIPPGALLQTFDIPGYGGVTALEVLPDGRRVLLGCWDNTLRLFDLESEESQVFEGHTDRVTAVGVLPDRRHVLSGSADKTLRLWDLESGECRVLEGHTTKVIVVAPLLDGRRALSGSDDGRLRLWDLESGESCVLKGRHTGKVTAIALLPDCRRALSCSDDENLQLWDLESAESRAILTQTGKVTAVALLPDGRRALCSHYEPRTLSDNDDEHGFLAYLHRRENSTLRLWELESGASRVLGHMGNVTAMAVLPDGQRALCGGMFAPLRLWDLESGEGRALENWYAGSVTAVALLPDGRRALSSSPYGNLRLWDLENVKSWTFDGHTNAVTQVAFLPDGRRALSSSNDWNLRLWNLDSGESRVLAGHSGSVSTIALLPDGQRALSGAHDHTLRLWDLRSGKSRLLDGWRGPRVAALALLSDGRHALSCHSDPHTPFHHSRGPAIFDDDEGSLRLWDLETGKSRVLGDGKGSITAVALLPDGRRVLSGSAEGTLWLWDLEVGGGRQLEGCHMGPITEVALLPNCQRALSSSHDGSLRLWDLESGDSTAIVSGKAGQVTPVKVMPDGRRALSGSLDGTLRLWELNTGESQVLEGHTERVKAVVVLPDGRRALSGSDDNSLILWDLETATPITAFVGDSGMTCIAITGSSIIAGSQNGLVHVLRIVRPCA